MEEQNIGEADEECLRARLRRSGGGFYLQDVWPRLFHDVCEAEEVKEGFSHKPFPLAVAPQRLTDLRLVGFSGDLRERKHVNETLLYLTGCISGDSGGENTVCEWAICLKEGFFFFFPKMF